LGDLPGLAPIILPDEPRFTRERIVPARLRTAEFDARYDFRTLAYDTVAAAEGGVRLYCPKLLNFEALLNRGTFRLDGTPARLGRIRRYERYDVVEIPGPPARRLDLSVHGWDAEVTASPLDRATFAGLNCLLTVSRNNELHWIRDWVRFHMHEHGVEAVLLFDNGSIAYPLDAIREELAQVQGLKAFRVVSADFPYGPQASRRMKFRANFLQAALLNLARYRFLADARGVLVCDVDELVIRRDGVGSVFDAALATRSGLLRIPGAWRYPDTTPGEMPLHRGHVRQTQAPRSSPPKYCIVPSGRMREKSWATHGLHGVPFGWRFIDNRFRFLHCYGISDFWKGRPKSQVALATEIDAEAERALARAFD
jgi:hypothetical protein